MNEFQIKQTNKKNTKKEMIENHFERNFSEMKDFAKWILKKEGERTKDEIAKKKKDKQ